MENISSIRIHRGGEPILNPSPQGAYVKLKIKNTLFTLFYFYKIILFLAHQKQYVF